MNKGFISFAFLTFFLQLLFYVEIFTLKMTTQNKIFDSMQEVNQRISLEALLIDEINCYLKNEAEIPQQIQVADTQVTLFNEISRIEATFEDGYRVIVTIVDNQVYDLEIVE